MSTIRSKKWLSLEPRDRPDIHKWGSWKHPFLITFWMKMSYKVSKSRKISRSKMGCPKYQKLHFWISKKVDLPEKSPKVSSTLSIDRSGRGSWGPFWGVQKGPFFDPKMAHLLGVYIGTYDHYFLINKCPKRALIYGKKDLKNVPKWPLFSGPFLSVYFRTLDVSIVQLRVNKST